MANLREGKSKSTKLNDARWMPPRYHKLPNEEYSPMKSEVIAWLVRLPNIREFLWDKIKQSGDVVYNHDTGKWQGVDYKYE